MPPDEPERERVRLLSGRALGKNVDQSDGESLTRSEEGS